MFLLCMAEVHGCFTTGVELLTRCQEAVMNRDNEALLQEMVELKAVIDQLPFIFHKISVNPNAGEQFANPVEWGQRYAKFSAPLSKRVPALSGLALPLFLLMDAFIGRTKYTSFLGVEAVHLRRWLPLNIRAFITAIENHYRIPDFVKKSGDPKLVGVLEGIIESYAGERGFMGTHRYKVYGFLEVVAKTGRTETNGNAASAQDSEGRAGLFPDGMTMRCLWVSLRLALGSSQQPNSNSLPSPRELLAETVQWWTLVRSRYDAERFRMGLAAESHGAVTSLMMHCFSYAKDFPGSLVALHALKDKFGIWPTEKAVEILQRQAAWFDQRDADQSLRAHHGMSVEENLDRMRQVFQILEDRRLEGMGITRYDYAHMSVDELRQLDLNLLSEFVRVLLKREHTPAEVEHMIDEAKSQIGLPGLLTGDLDAFSVA